jgi:UDP-N-acetylmuramate dehydrogenase
MTVRLADHTTLGVGGPADVFVVTATEADLVAQVSRCDDDGNPVLILGGGSNIVCGDSGFCGTVIQASVKGLGIVEEYDHVIVTVGCGEPWDDLVAFTVSKGWAGIEAMSGIPGFVGATPIQNVGAYGQDVAGVISNVRVFDRDERMIRDLPPDECAFRYRGSALKDQLGRWVVLAVSFRLAKDPWSVVKYAQLAHTLGVEVGAAATCAAVRDAVLDLRRGKGMVLDAADPDTRSAGSFFTNPIVSSEVAALLAPACPRYPADRGVKVSAAWLIEQAGISPGWQLHRESGARVSGKHSLALTNAGDATTEQVLDLARAIQRRVQERFGIGLVAEPTLVNCSL